MALNVDQAVRLSRALRDPRECMWSGHVPTQSQLANVLSSEGRVASPIPASSGSPDLQKPAARLYEWAPNQGGLP